MSNVFIPENILPDGEDHTTAVNPFTGYQGRARKGTVAATLNNIALLNRLLLDNAEHDKIAPIKKAIIDLMPSLKAVGIFDLFDPLEWISSQNHPGRTYVAILYLKHYPEEMNKEIVHKLEMVKEAIESPFFQSELQSLLKRTTMR